MTVLIILCILALICGAQVYCSSVINRGGHWAYGAAMFCLGMGISFLWVLLSKYSTNLIRDGLIWDIIVAMIFSILLIAMGHGQHFTLKHWIGMALTLGVFFYWGLTR